MSDKYQTIHKQVLDFLENLVQKAETFELKKEIVPEGKQLDDYLSKLESSLGNKGKDLKYATRMTARIRDIFKIHYWSDIQKENWDLLYRGIEELSNPEKITRENLSGFGERLLQAKLTWFPVTERAEKDIEKAKNQTKNYIK